MHKELRDFSVFERMNHRRTNRHGQLYLCESTMRETGISEEYGLKLHARCLEYYAGLVFNARRGVVVSLITTTVLEGF